MYRTSYSPDRHGESRPRLHVRPHRKAPDLVELDRDLAGGPNREILCSYSQHFYRHGPIDRNLHHSPGPGSHLGMASCHESAAFTIATNTLNSGGAHLSSLSSRPPKPNEARIPCLTTPAVVYGASVGIHKVPRMREGNGSPRQPFSTEARGRTKTSNSMVSISNHITTYIQVTLKFVKTHVLSTWGLGAS